MDIKDNYKKSYFNNYIKNFFVKHHNEYSRGSHKSPKITAGAVIKNPQLLKFVPYYLKTKEMCNYAVNFFFYNKVFS